MLKNIASKLFLMLVLVVFALILCFGFGKGVHATLVRIYPSSDTVIPCGVVSNRSDLVTLIDDDDVTEKYEGTYHAAAVGEVNVTTKMKECGALIGGEGNGGVIYPALHYGRDAMVGVALFLTNLAYKKMKVSELLATYPEYVIAKNKIELSDSALIDRILDEVKTVYAAEDINTIDGVKISFESRKEWVHLRRSNTEPIIRIYAEAATKEAADALAQQIIDIAESIIK